jgi:hypothetical protein
MNLGQIHRPATYSLDSGQDAVDGGQTLVWSNGFAVSKGERTIEPGVKYTALGQAEGGEPITNLADAFVKQPLVGKCDTTDASSDLNPLFESMIFGECYRFFS